MKIIRRGHYKDRGAYVLIEDDLTKPARMCRYSSGGARWNKKDRTVSFCFSQEDYEEPGATTHEYTVVFEIHEILELTRVMAYSSSTSPASNAIIEGAIASLKSIVESSAESETK